MIENKERWKKLNEMSEEECIEKLDPICEAFKKSKTDKDFLKQHGMAALPNRLFALAALDLYEEWQMEALSRE